MKMIYLSYQEQGIEFAKKAARYMADHPKCVTYTEGDVEAGCYLAIRWGLLDDCVVVVKLDDDFEPMNYKQLIRDYVEQATEEVNP